ncbi:hypothetical protein BAY61_18345 [Prauserella marina]|nr:hypothetical protein BAY61_18345 [Prauserella marina]
MIDLATHAVVATRSKAHAPEIPKSTELVTRRHVILLTQPATEPEFARRSVRKVFGQPHHACSMRPSVTTKRIRSGWWRRSRLILVVRDRIST